MLAKIRDFFVSWQGALSLSKLAAAGIRLAIYSEGQAYRGFLLPVVNRLSQEYGEQICYITSDPNDDLLKTQQKNLSVVYIGEGSALIYAFQTLKFRLLAMTMPDLNTYHIKRSVNPVHYLYLQHSLVSTHMVYREGAFDHFDSVFCAGSHQISEIRAWEKLNKLAPKNLYEHGYAPLEKIIMEGHERPENGFEPSSKPKILIAPSWGERGLLETGAHQLVKGLLDAGFDITFRPHPQSHKTSSDKIKTLDEDFSEHASFQIETDTAIFDSLYGANILISDWSGIALEYAFGLERPVIFLDVPRKVHNPRYKELELKPIEDELREKLGVILAPQDYDQVPKIAQELMDNLEGYANNARALRSEYVFNLGKSAEVGAKLILDILDDLKENGG